MKCPRCESDNAAAQKFCGECGARLPAGAGTPGAPIAHPPRHLAERILTSRAALEGERKQVTVLFADLKGSMELLADRDPEAARALLDPVLELMMEAVHRYEGTVNQVLGDGIMALFGAPVAHEDHAVRACYAALRMQESARRYADDVRRAEGVPIQIRVGLNSGEVVVRSIGSDLHMDYTAIGQTTHLAARMEQIAPHGAILTTAATLRLAEGYVDARALGPARVKGLAEPVEVWEVIGAGPARSRLQAATARGLTPFVGRDAELGALTRALEDAGAGRGQVVSLAGGAGVGKSRLVYELARSPAMRGWRRLAGGAVAHGQASPYLPVVELLRSYFDVEDRHDPRVIRERVIGTTLALDPALQPAVPALLSLLDVGADDPAWQALDAPQRRERIITGVTALLVRESRRQPLALVLEDLHWADSGTLALLDALVERVATAPMLLLVNHRPEYQPPWAPAAHARELPIAPLPPASAGELLRSLLGDDPSLAPVTRLLIERTDGNPFFLEESVRALADAQVIAGARGAYRAAAGAPRFHLPPTVQSILAARIDRLTPEAKGLLQAAAVIGHELPRALLQDIAELGEDSLGAALQQLETAEFLDTASLFPDLEYRFRHGLTQEVAYASLLHERRRALHAAIVRAIERRYPDRLAEHVERLAHHAAQAGMWAPAAAYCRQAGAKAAARSAYGEAAACFEQGVAAVDHLPEEPHVLEQAVDLRLDLRNARHALGEFARTLAPLREAQAIAERHGDQRRLGRIYASLSQYYRLVDDLDQAIGFGERALAAGGALDELVLQVVSRVSLGQGYHALGEYRRAIEVLRWNIERLDGPLLHDRLGQVYLPSVFSRAWLGRCLAELGEFGEAIARGDEAVAIAEEAGHPFSAVTADYALGVAHLGRGDTATAAPILQRGVTRCEAWGFRSWLPPIRSALGAAHLLAGRLDVALPALEHAVAEADAMGLMGRQALRLVRLGEALLAAGREQDAAAAAGRALELCRPRKERAVEAWTLHLLGEIALRHDAAAARRHFTDALARAERLGMRPLVAHCHRALAHTEDSPRSREDLARATSMYQTLGMGRWVKRTPRSELA